MSSEGRKRYILDALDKKESLNVKELSRDLQVSSMTIRRDLASLEEHGFLVRTHGGAVKSSLIDSLFSFDKRVDRNSREKIAICRTAASLVEERDLIFIDCGTTLFRMCRYLKTGKRLRVITNSLPVVSELIHTEEIQLSFIGGEIDSTRRAAYGKSAERALGEYRARKAFIGTDGISLANGLSSYDEKEGSISIAMAEHADEVYLLADSSKLEQDSFWRSGSLDRIDYLITDEGIPGETYSLYRGAGIKVIIGKRDAE